MGVSLVIGLISFVVVLIAMGLMIAGLASQNQTPANRLPQIGAGIALIGLFGMSVVAGRESLLGITWWPAAVVILSGVGLVTGIICHKWRMPR
jgi:hypothetical protein